MAARGHPMGFPRGEKEVWTEGLMVGRRWMPLAGRGYDGASSHEDNHPLPQHHVQGGRGGGSSRKLPVPPPPPGGHPTACDRRGAVGDRYDGMVDYSAVKLGALQLTHRALGMTDGCESQGGSDRIVPMQAATARVVILVNVLSQVTIPKDLAGPVLGKSSQRIEQIRP